MWQKNSFPERHSAEWTERLISSDRDMWQEKLKNKLVRKADEAGIDLDVQIADRITRGSDEFSQIRSKTEISTGATPETLFQRSTAEQPRSFEKVLRKVFLDRL